MKLFAKYNRTLISVTLLIFLVAGIGIYHTLKYAQIRQVDSDLEIEEQEIKLDIEKYHELPTTLSVDDQLIQFTAVSKPYVRRHFLTTFLKDHSGEMEDHRQLVFGIVLHGKPYMVTVSKSLEETDDLIQAAFAITGITIMLILIALLIINRIVLKNLWRPFYQTLDAVKEFKVDSEKRIQFPQTNTEEFDTMAKTLDRSIHQAKTDYLALKTFSENASHEIQTPIAIIRSKIDMLMQDAMLTEEQSRNLMTVSSSLDQLSRLNNSLLLMAKIENRQFSSTQEIWLNEKIKLKMIDFEELWHMESITIDANINPARVNMNNELADILLNNLFSNATWHNRTNGKITILLNPNSLTISNTSNKQALNPMLVFERFYKSSQVSQSNGLGLSIIKQICETAHMHIEYGYNKEVHTFRISW